MPRLPAHRAWNALEYQPTPGGTRPCMVCPPHRSLGTSTKISGITDQGTNYTEEGDYSFSTSFPQPILMGAAFDDELIKAVATVISTEARAFNNVNRYVCISRPDLTSR